LSAAAAAAAAAAVPESLLRSSISFFPPIRQRSLGEFITSLELVGNRVGDEGARRIAHALNCCVTLAGPLQLLPMTACTADWELDHMDHGSVASRPQSSAILSHVTYLGLSSNGIRELGFQALALAIGSPMMDQAMTVPRVERLDLSKNISGPAGIEHLAHLILAQPSSRLKHLDVHDCGSSSAGEGMNEREGAFVKPLVASNAQLFSASLMDFEAEYPLIRGAEAVARALTSNPHFCLETLNFSGAELPLLLFAGPRRGQCAIGAECARQVAGSRGTAPESLTSAGSVGEAPSTSRTPSSLRSSSA
jgi:hypothetical protein